MTINSRGVDTKNTILNVSLSLFTQNGYDATSVAEICRQAQVSKGAFYHHFPSKQDLFLALMTSWLNEVSESFRASVESSQNIPLAIENIADQSRSLYDALQDGFPILLEFWRQANNDPEIWQQAIAPYRRFLSFFADAIQTGIQAGDFDESLDPDCSARIIMAVAMGLLLQASFDPEYEKWHQVTQAGIKLVLNSMRTTK